MYLGWDDELRLRYWGSLGAIVRDRRLQVADSSVIFLGETLFVLLKIIGGLM